MGRGIFWGGWLEHYLRQWPSRRWRRARCTSPDQNPATLIDRQLPRLNDFGLQILKICLIKIKLALQRPIGDPLMLLEDLQDSIEYVIEVHHHPPSVHRMESRCVLWTLRLIALHSTDLRQTQGESRRDKGMGGETRHRIMAR